MIFNPYHQWLGMAQNQTKPNYFELLQLEIRDADLAEFPAMVRQQAREKLKQLEQIDPQSHGEQLAALRNRIKKAVQILSDPHRRSEYLQALPVQPPSSTPTSTPTSTNSKNSRFKTPPASKPTPQRSKPGTGRRPLDLADLDSIPFAIPVKADQLSGRPAIPELPQKFIPHPAAANERSSQPGSNGEELTSDPDAFFQQLSLDSSASIKSASRRSPGRHRRKIPTWAVLLMLATLGIGTAGSLWYLVDRFSQPQPESLALADVGDSNRPASPADRVAETSPENQAESLLTAAANARLKDLEEGADPNPGDLDNRPNQSQPGRNRPGRARAPDRIEGRIEERIDVSQLPDDGMVEYEQFLANLSDIERYRFQFLLAKIRLEAFRNDWTEMQRASQSLGKWIEDLTGEDTPEPPSWLAVRFEEARQATASLSEFRKQLQSGIRQLPALNTIEIGEQLYAMVEKSEIDVVLRFEGRNLRYPLDFLPAQLAIRLAESAEIQNVPDWRFHQAQHLIHQLRDRPAVEPTIRKLIADSEADGYRAGWLWSLLADVATLGGGSAFAQDWARTGDSPAASTRQFREQQAYADPAQLPPAEALEKLLVLARVEREDLSQVVGLAREMVQLGVAAGDADWLHEGVLELAILQYPAAYSLLQDGLVRIAQQELDVLQTRKLYRLAQLVLVKQDRPLIVAGVALPGSSPEDLAEAGVTLEELKRLVTARLRRHNLQGMGAIEGSLR
jgi:hypothetical protein